eukprot:CAMPEP_0185194144 /NCGR_PEP_ID=MMETSP1140-20130426/29473_1 /TAXON_ID=298111 /ORGANISM="Pavlova sp., Strain CCMP459" /LENGTH=110 /DNA_ID=CAMNT_0027761041 /DNA_START=174 /DNA_END=502 /DNA_ORIENTATION=+
MMPATRYGTGRPTVSRMRNVTDEHEGCCLLMIFEVRAAFEGARRWYRERMLMCASVDDSSSGWLPAPREVLQATTLLFPSEMMKAALIACRTVLKARSCLLVQSERKTHL